MYIIILKSVTQTFCLRFLFMNRKILVLPLESLAQLDCKDLCFLMYVFHY